MTYKHSVRWTLLLLSMVQYAISDPCYICDVASHHMAAFDDKKVADFPLETYQDLASLRECTHMCLDNYRCRSYLYNRELRKCSTFAVGYSQPDNTYIGVVDETGGKLYSMCGREMRFGSGCNADTQCSYHNALCKNFRCACLPGYSFEATSGHCTKNCAQYGEFYDTYKNYGVSGCNRITSVEASLDACSQKCKNQTSFVCANADFKSAGGRCQLCDTSWFDLDPAARENSTAATGWTLTYRHCTI